MNNQPTNFINEPSQLPTQEAPIVDVTQTQPAPIIPTEKLRQQKMEIIVMQAIRFFNAERGCLISYPQEDTFVYELGRNALSQHLTEIEFVASTTVMKVAIRTKTPQMIPDISAYDNYQKAESIIMGKKRVIVCGPLVRNGKPIGVLYMDGQLPKARFSDDQLMLFNRLCERAAETLEQVQR